MRARLASALAALLLATPLARAQTPAAEVKDASNVSLLRVNTDAGFVVRGTLSVGTVPATGQGARLMWYPKKAAIRAGYATNDEWDDANVGVYSTAFGNSPAASGHYSTAMGKFPTASGDASTAMGAYTTASGDNATAMGLSSTAQAYASVALGRYNTLGLFGSVSATAWEADDPLLIAGNGTSSAFADRSNALYLRKDGNMTIAGTLTQNSDARLKEDVQGLTGARARVMALRPVSYRFRAGTNRPAGVQIGLVAQEVRAVYPELVREEADGYLSVAYANLAPVLAAAIQEQQAEIEALRAEVAALRALLEQSLGARAPLRRQATARTPGR